jgi:hypothetical protein
MADVRLLPSVVYDTSPYDWEDQSTSTDPADLVAAIAEEILADTSPFGDVDVADYIRLNG